jgi:hypothetical protein
MASGLYDLGREAFLAGDIDWAADNIRAVAVDTSDYTVDLATHNALDDVAAGSRVASSANLSGKSVANGVADCDDITFTAVAGDTISALVIYKVGGTEATSPLIAYIEAGPVTPNGTNITFEVDSGANKLFKL